MVRSIGHAVATAHKADHSLGAALYALKAVQIIGKSLDAEKKRQNKQLPTEIMELVLSVRRAKEKSFKNLPGEILAKEPSLTIFYQSIVSESD